MEHFGAPRIMGTLCLWIFGVVEECRGCRRSAELRGLAKGLVGFELLVEVD